MATETNKTSGTANQAIVLKIPPAGQTLVVNVLPNQVIEIPFDIAEANVTLVGDDLRMEFPGNAVLILNDFAAMVEQGTSPLMMFADGSVVAGDVLLTALTAELPETAAGPGGGSGGAGEYEDDMGALIGTVDRLGTQNPDPFAKAVELSLLDNQPDGTPSASINLAATLDNLLLDESPLTEDGVRVITADLADNFVFDFGPDGPGSVAYALSLNGTDVGSGLHVSNPDGTPGAEIVLNIAGGVIVGTAGATAYFNISVNPATGSVTFEQLANIWHGDTDNHDDTATLTAPPETIVVTLTVADSDGDTASARLDLSSGVFSVEDDGPSASINAAAVLDVMTLDESPLSEDGIWTTSANFADNFAGTVDFGTDGPGSVAYALSLAGSDLGSGLHALGTGGQPGAEIMLSMNGGNIVGTVGGTTYFTISLDADNGVVTFSRGSANIWHGDDSDHDDVEAMAGAILLTQVVKDADGDVVSVSLDLSAGVFRIEDDGPSVNISAAAPLDVLTLDESPLSEDGIWTTSANFADNFTSTADYGTDGPGSVTYALSLAGSELGSGLYALAAGGGQGAEIMLSMNGGDIVGTAGGTTYFTISLDEATGVVTFARTANIWHDSPANHDDPEILTAAVGTILLSKTVIDADNDSASAALDLSAGVFRIEDDGPEININAAVNDGTPSTDSIAENAGAPLAGTWTRDYGTDTDNNGDATPVATIKVLVGGNTYDLGSPIDTGAGTLTVNANGTWSFDPSDVLQTQNVSFTVRITDADGDTASDTHTITVTNVEPPQDAGGVNLTVEEAQITDSDSGTIDFTPGGNALTSMVFSGTIGSVTGGYGEIADITWTGAGTTTLSGTAPGEVTPSIVLTLIGINLATGNATVTATLSDDFKHTAGAGNNSFTINGIEVVVTDSGSDQAEGLVNVTVVDDIPTVSVLPAVADGTPSTDNVMENAEIPLSGTWTRSYGADTDANNDATAPATIKVTVAGVAGTYNLGDVIDTGAGELQVNADGTWTFDPVSVVQPRDVSFTVTITDADVDVASDTHTISILDGSEPLDADPVNLTVQETDLSPTDIDSDTIDFTPGTDSLTSMVFSGNVGLITGAYDEIADITWTGAGTTTLSGTAPGEAVPSIVLTLTGINLATGDATVEVTLSDEFKHSAGAGNNTFVINNIEVVAAEADTDQAVGMVNVTVVDDVPTAYADTNSASEGQQNVTGNVLTDNDDVFGADGADAAGGVVGVAAGNTGGALDSPATLGTAIETTYGFLTLNANGSYDYDAKANVAIPEGAQDVFTYTIKDGDGDLSFATLTIDLTDSGLTAANDDAVLVSEAALDLIQDGDDLAAGVVTGSLPGSPAETDSDERLDDNVTGGSGTKTFALVDGLTTTNAPVEGLYGWIQINSDGTYVYTLTKPFTSTDGSAPSTEDNAESFTYQVTNGNGNTETATIYINIVDDVPTAYADTNSASEGQQNVTGNVLTDNDDVFGADGADAAGGVVGVAAGNTGSALDSPATLGTAIESTYGFLTLNANGSYDYDAKANVVPPEGAQDVFTYTIKDGDGDLHFSTLTIELTDSGLMAPDDNDALVYEKALDTTQSGSDLAASIYTGSIPTNTGETDATNQLNATGGFAPLSYALVGAIPAGDGSTTLTGTYGVIKVNADGSYIYTLTKPFDTTPDADNSANTEQNKENFQYQVTDANGNTATGYITVDIVDDIPLYLAPDDTHVEDLAINPDIVENLNFLAGADGVQTAEFTMTLNHGNNQADWVKAVDADGNFLTFEGQQLYLFYGSNGTDLTRLEAKTALNGTLGFSIDIDPVANTYAVHSNGIISNGTATTATDLTGVGGGNVTWKALLNLGGTTQDVMMSTSAGNTVNTNATEIGISSGNSFTAGEGIRFDFLNDLTAGKVGNNWVFDYPNTDASHNPTKAWRQDISFVQGSGSTASIIVTALIADNDDLFYGDLAGETKVALLASNVKIYNAAGQLITNLAGEGITIDDSDPYSVTITGLKEGYDYSVFSPDPFTAIQVDAVAGTSEFKLGFFSYGEDSFGSPIELSYDVLGTDNDGDTATGQINLSFYPDGLTWTGTGADDTHTGDADDNVILGDGGNDNLSGGAGNDVIDGNSGDDTIDGGAGNDNLHGGSGADSVVGGLGNDFIDGDSGNDILSGGDGDDLFIGGIGNDIMEGNAGADTFAFSAKGGEGHDHINNFDPVNDILSFHDVLNNDGDADIDLNDLLNPANPQYVEFSKSLDEMTIDLTVHGISAEPTTITLHAAVGSPFTEVDSLQDLNVQVDPNSYSN